VFSVFFNNPADNPGNLRVNLFKDGSLWHTPWVIKEDMMDVSGLQEHKNIDTMKAILYDMAWAVSEEFNPAEVIGKPYREVMLPYGGGFSLKSGKVVFATSRKEHERIMAVLRSLE